ncbi:class F sortase, partial [Kitasatospora sp. NPDC004240]
AASPAAAAAPLKRSRPTRLRIAQIGVDAPFTELTLDAAGALNAPPPDDRNLVGWYRDGVSPGERGAAVLAGHVDTRTGPAVFLLLSLLVPGNRVEVVRADGTVAVFAVDSVQTFRKDAFPDQQVYGKTPDAQLRLITCGGTYDKKRKDYPDNVVVFAHLESSRKA